MAEPANSSSASVGQTAVMLTSGGKCFEQTHTVNFLDLDIITSTISGCNVKQKNFHGMKTSVLKEFMMGGWKGHESKSVFRMYTQFFLERHPLNGGV